MGRLGDGEPLPALAGATARNITGFNETRADPADRLPYLVIIIDELADLMMREGKKRRRSDRSAGSESPRDGHPPRPGHAAAVVNVVTGLIKANFPSRIAFAMASQIDSRTILDMPGAEDLIGRATCYSSLPTCPARSDCRASSFRQGDRQYHEHWRAEAEPHYDMGIIETGEETEGVPEPLDEDADRLFARCRGRHPGVRSCFRVASAATPENRLRRAARIIDQMEARATSVLSMDPTRGRCCAEMEPRPGVR